MKRYFFLPLLVLTLTLVAFPVPAFAQADSPPEETPTGVVFGTIINQSNGETVTKALEVMLHIWDQDYVDLGMEHGEVNSDGTFKFSDVTLSPDRQYAVMTIFDGVTYFSDVVPGPVDLNEIELTVFVMETTSDLANVQVDQLHLLFSFAEDGMETTEIYVLSNFGERTVKDAVTLDDGRSATLRFPLPADADYIFFQPNEKDRFAKFPGGFADAYPLLPGKSSKQIMVQYLVPFSSDRTYTYTAPVNIQTINFLLPEESGVTLEGKGLSAAQPYTMPRDTTPYHLYSFGALSPGETIEVVFKGEPSNISIAATNNSTMPIVLGGAILGLTMIGVGFWWWRKPDEGEVDDDEIVDTQTEFSTFEDIITEIARLDEANEQGLLNEEDHEEQRQILLLEAKKNYPSEFGKP